MRRRRLRRRLLAAVDGIERRRGLQAELLRAATSPPPVEAREWVISAAVEGLAASTTAPLPALRLVAAQRRSWQRRIGPLKNSKRRTFFISTRATSEQKKTRQKRKRSMHVLCRGPHRRIASALVFPWPSAVRTTRAQPQPRRSASVAFGRLRPSAQPKHPVGRDASVGRFEVSRAATATSVAAAISTATAIRLRRRRKRRRRKKRRTAGGGLRLRR